jgi:hypothetical protein
MNALLAGFRRGVHSGKYIYEIIPVDLTKQLAV